MPFNTLSDLQNYVAQHTEAPHSDDEDWNDPDYTSYQASLKPNMLTKTLRSWGLSPQPLWDIALFKKRLQEVIEQRKKADLSGRKVALLQLSYPTHIVICGNLEGCLHSFTRDLTWLEQQGILNNNFEIIKKDYLFVVYGDTLNRSAYTLEMLTTLMTLLYRNPDQMIWVRGLSEDNNKWLDYGLKRELLTRLGEPMTGEIPLNASIDAFFNTLPLAFYISTLKSPHTFIRISAEGFDSPELNEDAYGSFWDKPPRDTLTYHDITQKKASSQKVSVEVIIKSENSMHEMRAVSGEPRDLLGLGLLEQDRGTTAWSILSSPNMAHQKFFGFDYDAFGIITVGSTIQDSAIVLYNQQISNQRGFKKHEAFNLLTGIILSRANTFEKNFNIGSTLGLISGLPVISQCVMRGMSARIQQANASNTELTTLHLSLTTYNDNYNAVLARKNVIELTNENNADVILLPIGALTLDSYTDLIKQNKILTLFPVTGGEEFFKPELHGLINYRPSYEDEVNVLLDHIINQKMMNKFAFFYQDTEFGRISFETSRAYLQKKGISKCLGLPYLPGTLDFKKQVEALKQEGIQAIGFFASPIPAREFIQQLGTANLTDMIIFSDSFLGEKSIRHFAKRQGITILLTAIVPNPRLSNLPIVQEYREQMDVNQYDYDTFSLEAYIATSILVDALDHIEKDTTGVYNKNYSHANIKKYIESLKDYDLKGIKLSFNPQTRSLNTRIWLETGPDTPWIEYSNIQGQQKPVKPAAPKQQTP